MNREVSAQPVSLTIRVAVSCGYEAVAGNFSSGDTMNLAGLSMAAIVFASYGCKRTEPNEAITAEQPSPKTPAAAG